MPEPTLSRRSRARTVRPTRVLTAVLWSWGGFDLWRRPSTTTRGFRAGANPYLLDRRSKLRVSTDSGRCAGGPRRGGTGGQHPLGVADCRRSLRAGRSGDQGRGGTSVMRTTNEQATWRVQGIGSRIVMPVLEVVEGIREGAGWCPWRLLAEQGGRLDLASVTTLTNGWFSIQAYGASSVVDPSQLTRYASVRPDHSWYAGGRIHPGAIRTILSLRAGADPGLWHFVVVTEDGQVVLKSVESDTTSSGGWRDDIAALAGPGAGAALGGGGRSPGTGLGSGVCLAGIARRGLNSWEGRVDCPWTIVGCLMKATPAGAPLCFYRIARCYMGNRVDHRATGSRAALMSTGRSSGSPRDAVSLACLTGLHEVPPD